MAGVRQPVPVCFRSRSGPRSAALEGAGLALFGEGAGGFLEVLRQVQLQWRRLHPHFALELVHIPATGADRRANRERRVLRDFGSKLESDFKMAAFRRDAGDYGGPEGFSR